MLDSNVYNCLKNLPLLLDYSLKMNIFYFSHNSTMLFIFSFIGIDEAAGNFGGNFLCTAHICELMWPVQFWIKGKYISFTLQ